MGAFDNLEEDTSNELALGPDSAVPEDALAASSLLKDVLTGKTPVTRARIAQAGSQDLNEITARKAALNEALQTGQLSSSQTVGLGMLAMALMAAGAAVKGKRGISAAGGAVNLGGQVLMEGAKNEAAVNNKKINAQLGALNSQEAATTKMVTENAMAPLRQEEKIAASVEAAKRKKAAGVGGGITINNMAPDKISQTESRQAAQAMGSVQEALAIAKELRKLPSEDWKDTASWQAKASTTATKEGKLYARAFDFAKQKVKVLNPGNPSEWEGKTGLKTTIGDIITGPRDIAQLLEQSAGVLANTAASNLETAGQLRSDPSTLIKQYRDIAKSVGVDHVQPGILGEPGEEVDEEGLIPDELKPDEAPKKAGAPAKKTIGSTRKQPKEITYQGKRGRVIDGVFHPYMGQ